MDTIKERIDEISKEYARYNAVRLAEMIGMKSVTVTNYMNGSRKPSLEFITKILENIPDISADWLILGNGQMKQVYSNVQHGDFNTNLHGSVMMDSANKYGTTPEERQKDQLILSLEKQIKLYEKILKDNNIDI